MSDRFALDNVQFDGNDNRGNSGEAMDGGAISVGVGAEEKQQVFLKSLTPISVTSSTPRPPPQTSTPEFCEPRLFWAKQIGEG